MKNAKKAFVASLLAVVLCVSMLTGTTFAWFTDSVTSAGNIIKSGTLDVEMSWANGTEDPAASATTWTDASTGAIFDYSLWEPGYTQVRHIAVENVGTLALKYQLRVVQNGAATDLADVIDVYTIKPAVAITSRTALNGLTPTGTVATSFTGSLGEEGHLLPGEKTVFTIALKMRESAGNEYQNKSIGSDFSVKLLATQYTYEEDSFDNQYDAQADETPDNAGWSDEVSTATATVVAGEATTFVAAAAPATETANTTVTFPADTLTANTLPKLEVKTTDTESAAQTAYSVLSDGDTAAGAIDLSLVVGDTEVTEFSGPVVIETKIAAGLSNVTISYNGDASKKFGANNAGTKVDSAAEVDEIGKYYYNPTDGTLVFATDHFSEYVIGTTSVAYSSTTDTAYATVQEAIAATAKDDTVVLLNDASFKLNDTLITDKNGIALTKSIKIYGANHTLTSGAGLDRVFDVNGVSEDITITIQDLTMVGPTAAKYPGGYTRGISFYANTGKVVLNLDHAAISADYYAINVASENVGGVEINVSNTSLSAGWCAAQSHSPNCTMNFSDSVLTGTNDKSYNADGWNNFATLVVNETAPGTTINLTNCVVNSDYSIFTVEEEQVHNKQWAFSFRAADTVVNSNNTKYYVNGEEKDITIGDNFWPTLTSFTTNEAIQTLQFYVDEELFFGDAE